MTMVMYDAFVRVIPMRLLVIVNPFYLGSFVKCQCNNHFVQVDVNVSTVFVHVNVTTIL